MPFKVREGCAGLLLWQSVCVCVVEGSASKFKDRDVKNKGTHVGVPLWTGHTPGDLITLGNKTEAETEAGIEAETKVLLWFLSSMKTI